jgi:hypothetical protein
METWEIVTMSRKEARRPGLVQLAVAGQITTAAGAHALDMTPRQFRRLKTRYRAEGSGGWSTASGAGPRPGRWSRGPGPGARVDPDAVPGLQ